jgi:hypothetical protein
MGVWVAESSRGSKSFILDGTVWESLFCKMKYSSSSYKELGENEMS